MADLDLEDLLAQLREVASASDPDSDDDRDPEDDTSDIPEDEIPDDQDLDDEEGEDGDREGDDDFSKPKIYKTVMLLQKLQAEAKDKMYLDRKREFMQPKPVGRAVANNTKIRQLRQRTNEMRYELESSRQLEAEVKRNQEAAVALYRSNMTPAQKQEHDEDTRRMAVYASQLCREASPDWRADAAKAMAEKKL